MTIVDVFFVILAMKTKFSTTAISKEISPNKCVAGGQPEINMATETGNANIFGTLTDRMKISTANLEFLRFDELDKSVCKKSRQ